MALSRVRLGLAFWFAVVFLAGLAVLDFSLYWYLRNQSDRRLTRDLAAVAAHLAVAGRREYAEAPAEGLAAAAANATGEWPTGPEAVAIYDASGTRLATGGAPDLARFAPLHVPLAAESNMPLDDEASVRLLSKPSGAEPAFTAVAIGSTERLTEDEESLAWWLAFSSPLVAVLSLLAGYFVSRRALRPIAGLGQAVAAIGPDRLDRRLPIPYPADEIGRLALQFNELLDRLQDSRAQTQLFLQRAAHQIRTPLTLVLGESELALERPAEGGHRPALDRIHRAATQMQRRVSELFMLAQAEAGESIAIDSRVDLDGLALEATDLMRERAQTRGRPLELARIEAVTVHGNPPLLHEALVELLENALRHSAPGATVAVSTFGGGGSALLAVSSEGPDPRDGVPVGTNESRGFGLAIVRWIARQHGGELVHTRNGGWNTYALVLPPAPPRTGPGE